MKFGFSACGSHLRVELFDVHENNSIEEHSREIVEKFENTYSRFIPGNFLDILNTNKKAPLNEELLALIKLAQKVSKISE